MKKLLAICLLCATPALAQSAPTDAEIKEANRICNLHSTAHVKSVVGTQTPLATYQEGWEHCVKVHEAAEAIRTKEAEQRQKDANHSVTKAIADKIK